MANVLIAYYSSTGNTYALARAIEEGAQCGGATTRLCKTRELAPDEAIATNEGWGKHIIATQDVPIATNDDLEWADGYAFGTPTRYGTISAQLKQFVDGTGALWFAGALANKAATGFSGAATTHGGHEGTIQDLHKVFSHWDCIIVPPGYTNPIQFDPRNGNPYGVSFTDARGGEVPAAILEAARWQGERLARVASLIADHRSTIAAPATRAKDHVTQ